MGREGEEGPVYRNVNGGESLPLVSVSKGYVYVYRLSLCVDARFSPRPEGKHLPTSRD